MRVGIEHHTISHYTLLRGLKKANLAPSHITLYQGKLNALIHEFKTGQLDTLSLYDPHIFKLNQSNTAHNILFSSKEIPKEICDVVIVHTDIIDRYPTFIHQLRNQWFQATRTIIDYSLLPRPIYQNTGYQRHLRHSLMIATEAENEYAFGTPSAPGYLFNTLRNVEHFMHQQQLIPTINTHRNHPIIYFSH
jgi:hypothetical protein